MQNLDPLRVTCPTCRARQEWSDTCRRCKSDLRLLRGAVNAYFRRRRLCLEMLQAGRPREAARHAWACAELHPGTEAHRLLALCALVAHDWEGARELAQSTITLENGQGQA